MKINFIKKEIDEHKHYTTGVQLNVSSVEYLIIIDAIRQFVENSTNHDVDIKIAKQMIKVIEKDIKFRESNSKEDYHEFVANFNVLEQISDEVNKLKKVSDGSNVYVDINDVFDVIDKYKRK